MVWKGVGGIYKALAPQIFRPMISDEDFLTKKGGKSSKRLFGLAYVVLSFIFWLIVEWITVWRIRWDEWMSYMPWALYQYLFIIAIFWYFLIMREWTHKSTLIVMIIVMYVFEFLWQNFLLLSIFWFIPSSFLLIQIWGFLTFLPLWLLERSLKEHKVACYVYCTWPIVGFLLALMI